MSKDDIAGTRIFSLSAIIVIALCSGLFTFSSPTDAAASAGYPHRIVSLGPINTENVFLLGAGDRLVGNTVYCVRPEEAKKKMKVGTVLEVSIEKILSLEPDLILATGLTPEPFAEKLRDLGLHVEKFDQPATLNESCEQLLRLGHLLGLEDEAQRIVDDVRKEVSSIKTAVSGLPKQKVLLQIGSQPLYGSVPSTFTHDFIELANGKNIIDDQSVGRTSYEKVIVRSPDVIIIAIMGSETGVAGQEKRKWLKYPTIKAVHDRRIHIIDPNIACSPSPATFIQALRIIAGFIHPDAGLNRKN